MADYQNNRGGNNANEDKRPKAPVDWSKLAMSAPVEGVQGAWSSLTWDLVGSNVRLTLWTNDPQDKENDGGKITTSLTMTDFYVFLKILDMAIKARGEFKRTVDSLNWFGFGGKRQETPRVEASLVVGKDATGLMYILLTAPKRPNIVFHFEPRSPNKQFRDETGTILGRPEVSVMYASAYHQMLGNVYQLDMLSQLLKIAEPDKYKPAPVPKWQQNGAGSKPAGGGNGGGGYQRGGQSGGGGYQNNRPAYGGGNNNAAGGSSAAPARAPANDEVDDDIPY